MRISIYNKLHAWVKRSIPCFMLFFGLLTIQAQNTEEHFRAIYDGAEQDYNIGRLEEAEQKLIHNLKNFPLSLRSSAYRMLALCYLGLDQEDDARHYVQLLLNQNPYYSTTINDPQRFIDMVNDIKSGLMATITTASSQAESLNEVPVATTLITEEMIRDIGANNLQEVLAAYVPGMTIIDCNDDINIAMRGIYSNGQEKILIMLNGHRLNSYCTNIASPDFSISLEKIKQIEVLRGPASSLYGGVALTAVVNLITKQGADIDGFKVKGSIGNHGQMRGDVLIGKRYFDLDMMLWGSLYRSKGENVFMSLEETGLLLSDGDVTIGAIGNKPTYDAGAMIKYKDLKFLYNTHFSQIQSPLSMTYTFTPYDVEKYKTYNGIRPSFTTNSHHVELSYEQQVGKVFLNTGIYYDNSDLTHYQVITEPKVSALAEALPIPESISKIIKTTGGISRYINGQEHTIGGKLQGSWNYINNQTHKGQLSFGGEYNYFTLDDVRYTFGYSFNQIIPESNEISNIGKGHENNVNGYMQLKHQWNSFILNAGLRFDFMKRYNQSNIKELSPRIALIFVQPKWNLKLSYSKAFIDAPYFYRKTNLFLEKLAEQSSAGGTSHYLTEDLSPETLHSIQLTFGATQWLKGFNFEVNGFYNIARDLIYMDFYEHFNAGDIDNYGIEFSGRYEWKRLTAQANLTWQKVKDAEILFDKVEELYNIPKLSANAILAYNITNNLRIHTHACYYSKQTAHYIDLAKYALYNNAYKEFIKFSEENPAFSDMTPEMRIKYLEMANDVALKYLDRFLEKTIDPRIIFDLGADFKYKNLEISANIKNIFNTSYYQSGMSTRLLPQKGRWFLISMAYKF